MKEITLLSFPQTSGMRGGTNIKVPAIKALRCFASMGLKEAKEMIEALQDGKPAKVTLAEGDQPKEALKDFHRLGGEYTTSDKLPELLREALEIAVRDRQYAVATHISASLDILY